MQTPLAVIPHLKSCVVPEALLDGSTPLLDVLRRSVRIKGGEANHGRSQDRLWKVEAIDARGKIIALLGDRENDRHVV